MRQDDPGAPRAPEREGDQALRDARPLRILVVEESAIDAGVIEHMLRRSLSAQVHIDIARDLATASRHLAAKPADVLLLTLVVPNWDLTGTMVFITAHAPRVPIVVLSSSADPVMFAETLKALAQDYLVKWQFNAHDLWRSIRYAIERHRGAEELRLAKQEAEQANQAKSRFLATMSHEIRTPLATMLGMAELLASSPLSPDQRRHLELMREAGEHLGKLLSDLLDTARIEAGRLSLESAPFRPRDVLEAALRMFRSAAAAKGIALSSEIAASVPDGVRGDAHRLRQVLINLIGNAVKFTDSGAVLVTLAPATPDGLRFTVRDTGPGISADVHERLFLPFVQAEASTARTHGGTGLGLAISRGLIELMGGKLELTTQPGRGSSFTFVLPLPTAVPAAREPAAAAPVLPRPLEIVVIEDTPALRVLLEAYLAPTGHHVELFADGAAALARLQRPADLLLVDLQLPGLDGFEVVERLRAQERAAHQAPVPVIAMTADARTETRRRCESQGFIGFLAKPFSRAALVAAVAAAAGPSSSVSGPAGEVGLDADAAALLPGYLRACRRDLATAATALAAAEFASLAAVGHRLKGGGSMFGLPALSAAGAALERAAKAADRAAAGTALSALAAALPNSEPRPSAEPP